MSTMSKAILDHVTAMADRWYNEIDWLLQDNGATTSDMLKLVIMTHKGILKDHRYDYDLYRVAIECNDYDLVRFLIDQGVNINARSRNDDVNTLPADTVLNMAIYEDNDDIIKILLNNGADVSIKTMHTSSPLVATTRLYSSIAEMLIKYGADVNGQDSIGNTALHYAVESGNHRLIQLLTNNGADESIVNEEGMAPYGDEQ